MGNALRKQRRISHPFLFSLIMLPARQFTKIF